MSFAFGFSGDDIEDDGEEGLSTEMSKHTISEGGGLDVASIQPKVHSLEDLLLSIPSQLSYNALTLPSQVQLSTPTAYISSHDGQPHHVAPTTILRRSLFDIRAQLMAESDMDNGEGPHQSMISTTNLLSGLENGDLTSGVYEGGFKTWECALDLASLCSRLDLDAPKDWKVIELGAGSAIPSLVILRSFLARNAKENRARAAITFCDYNEDVLRLGTVPNVLLNHAQQCGIVDSLSLGEGATAEGDLDMDDVDENYISGLGKDLRDRELSVEFISGAWGDIFVDLALPLPSPDNGETSPPTNLLILASETIYLPSATKVFADTLLRLLRRHQDLQKGGVGGGVAGDARAWVAAKKVYFGVGGGVDDFKQEIRALGGDSRVILETSDTGVGRVVIEVTVPQ